MKRFPSFLFVILLLAAALPSAVAGPATNAPQPLPYAQSWTNTAQITTADDWSGVPGVVGYRGDELTAVTGVDPQGAPARPTGRVAIR